MARCAGGASGRQLAAHISVRCVQARFLPVCPHAWLLIFKHACMCAFACACVQGSMNQHVSGEPFGGLLAHVCPPT
eukprot:365861-Chlamydomonas_euryale.AAC.13